MSLSDTQIDHFQTHGYTAVPNFLFLRASRTLVRLEGFS